MASTRTRRSAAVVAAVPVIDLTAYDTPDAPVVLEHWSAHLFALVDAMIHGYETTEHGEDLVVDGHPADPVRDSGDLPVMAITYDPVKDVSRELVTNRYTALIAVGVAVAVIHSPQVPMILLLSAIATFVLPLTARRGLPGGLVLLTFLTKDPGLGLRATVVVGAGYLLGLTAWGVKARYVAFRSRGNGPA